MYDALSNEKCLRQSVNRLQTKDNRVGSYKINNNFIVLFSWQNISPKQ